MIYGGVRCWLFAVLVVNSCVIARGETFKPDRGDINLQTVIRGLRVVENYMQPCATKTINRVY